MLQKRKLNIDAADYEINIDANLYKSSEKRKFNRVDIDKFCPTSIKDTIQWFHFLTIMEHTSNITEKNNGLIPSLLKVIPYLNYVLITTKKK